MEVLSFSDPEFRGVCMVIMGGVSMACGYIGMCTSIRFINSCGAGEFFCYPSGGLLFPPL